MGERIYLQKNTTILLRSDSDQASVIPFTIVRRIDEGASSVCYEAYHPNSGIGVLKEFYPNMAQITRSQEGAVIAMSESAHEALLTAQENYIAPYRSYMNSLRSGHGKALASFIPQFAIYYACDWKGNICGTAYVWTPQPELESFERFCDRVHRYPGRDPEQQLEQVLSAILTLTECITEMHQAGLLHRDIKPSNFGFVKRGDRILPDTLSMFDIDSICEEGSNRPVVGSDGYLEPEVATECYPQDRLSDLYAIGATLFHAIIITEETRDGRYLYRPAYFARIRDLIAESRLLQAYSAANKERLIDILTRILRGCLSGRGLLGDYLRYESSEPLQGDLRSALGCIRSAMEGSAAIAGIAVAQPRDQQENQKVLLAMQYHLYSNPLYECCTDPEEPLRVLIVGRGSYGEMFLDACLQFGQMPDHALEVTVVGMTNYDRKAYLRARPELGRFFCINDASLGEKESYGCIRFAEPTADGVYEDVLTQYVADQPHYIYITLGEDERNRVAAEICRKAVRESGIQCLVNYVCESGNPLRRKDRILRPVYVNQNIKESDAYAEVQRMAFNMHLSWKENICVDYKVVRREFRKLYNNASCVSGVLSLKYKLHAVGIDLGNTRTELARAARQFAEETGAYDSPIRKELVYIEHRRWVTEKLCQGWGPIDDLADCAGGVTKDERNKRHVCMVRSRPDFLLEDKTNKFGWGWWDQASEEELDELDDLDRMSVELHRMYARLAVTREQDQETGEMVEHSRIEDVIQQGDTMRAIREMIQNNPETLKKYEYWQNIMLLICWGQRFYDEYESAKNRFLQAVDRMPRVKDQVHILVMAVESIFYPALAYNENRIWKHSDVTIVDNIPFILTYTENIGMIIPCYLYGDIYSGTDGGFEGRYDIATVNPSQLIYVCPIRDEKDLQLLYDEVKPLASYAQINQLRAEIELVLVNEDDTWKPDRAELQSMVRKSSCDRIRKVHLVSATRTKSAMEVLRAYLERSKAASLEYCAIRRNENPLSAAMEQAGIYNYFGSYQFDFDRFRFVDVECCDVLQYITMEPKPVFAII